MSSALSTLAVYSFGSSGCTTSDGVDLTLTAAEARIDRVPADDRTVCTAVLSALPHPVELRFTTPGRAMIVVQGKVIDANSGRQTPGVVTKQLLVLP